MARRQGPCLGACNFPQTRQRETDESRRGVAPTQYACLCCGPKGVGTMGGPRGRTPVLVGTSDHSKGRRPLTKSRSGIRLKEQTSCNRWLCRFRGWQPLWSRPSKDGPTWFYSKRTATSVDSIGVSREMKHRRYFT